MKISSVILAAAIGVGTHSPANAQNDKQKKGEWSISVCEKNAARNGYKGGAAYCAKKAEEQRKKGRKITP